MTRRRGHSAAALPEVDRPAVRLEWIGHGLVGQFLEVQQAPGEQVESERRAVTTISERTSLTVGCGRTGPAIEKDIDPFFVPIVGAIGSD